MHAPVLLSEAVRCVVTRKDGYYVDATFGRGGHSREILRNLDPGGRVLAIDRDPKAVADGRQEFTDEPRLEIVQASFSGLCQLLEERGRSAALDGILLDLGVSSPQLDDPRRGFSFLHDGPLDMRMNQAGGIGAAEWLAIVSLEEITSVLRDFGEERHARRMAQAILRERDIAPIDTTRRLADIVAAANPAWERNKHPATRAFQAIRIFVNHEIDELDAVLQQSLDSLRIGARLVVISFHSLEDRRVKRFIRDQSRGPRLPRGLPVPEKEMGIRMRRLGRPIRPAASEVAANHRSRSAIMRVAEKLQ